MADCYDINGFDLLGIEEAQTQIAKPSFSGMAMALFAGLGGAFAWRAHPVLGFLGASAIASNAHALATKDRNWKQSLENVSRHVVATAGSLALPKYPAFGYIAAAVAADMLIDGKGNGIVEEWAHYAGVKDAKPEIIELKAA